MNKLYMLALLILAGCENFTYRPSDNNVYDIMGSPEVIKVTCEEIE